MSTQKLWLFLGEIVIISNIAIYTLFFQLCVIAECGELKEGDDWGIVPQDGSGDVHPDFPEDSDIDLKDVSFFLLRYFTECKTCR